MASADSAGKITGMLLEIDNSELLHMLDNRELLKSKVDEAVLVLQHHQQNASWVAWLDRNDRQAKVSF